MRNLIIKRRKSFLGCAAKIKFYYIDEEFGDTTIAGNKCTLLGFLKNGEEKVFQISEKETRIFAIYGAMTKNFSNDLYVIPEGDVEYHLYGKISWDFAGNNPFKFENNNSIESQENRKKSNKLGKILTWIAAAVGFIIGVLLFW